MSAKMLNDEEFKARFDQVVDELLLGEVTHSRGFDIRRANGEGQPGGSELFDSEKPVEFWLFVMEQKLAEARAAAVGSMDKREALKAVRKIGGLAVSCMIHIETPPRKEWE